MRHLNRWLKARDSEKDFWSQKDVKAIKTAVKWENFLKKNFGLTFNFFLSKNIIEVGCGPYGMIHFVDSHASVGMDPLLFDTWHDLGKVNASTIHIVAIGECLPFRDDVFDVCICFNVLDHSMFPSGVMREIVRILKPAGELLLWVNVIYGSLKVIAPLFNWIDKCHPYHFTFQEVFSLVTRNALEVTSIDKKNIGTGNFIQRFHGSLHVSFKLAVDCLLVFNMFVRARKRQKS